MVGPHALVIGHTKKTIPVYADIEIHVVSRVAEGTRNAMKSSRCVGIVQQQTGHAFGQIHSSKTMTFLILCSEVMEHLPMNGHTAQ